VNPGDYWTLVDSPHYIGLETEHGSRCMIDHNNELGGGTPRVRRAPCRPKRYIILTMDDPRVERMLVRRAVHALKGNTDAQA
jgi:hypothetical protein